MLFATPNFSLVCNTYVMLAIYTWHYSTLHCMTALCYCNSRSLRVMSFMLICTWVKLCYTVPIWSFCNIWSDKSYLFCSALILLWMMLLVICCTASIVKVSLLLILLLLLSFVLSRWSLMLLIHLSTAFLILFCCACNSSCSALVDYCHSLNLDYHRASRMLCLLLWEFTAFYNYVVSLCYSCNNLLSVTLCWLTLYNELSFSRWCHAANSPFFSLFISLVMLSVTVYICYCSSVWYVCVHLLNCLPQSSRTALHECNTFSFISITIFYLSARSNCLTLLSI